ncbi:UNVERIFIED_CONTAM: hypothetical protein FKN15_011845 [Acipenser sinensis]
MRGSKWPIGAAMVGGLPSPIAEGGSVHSPAPSWRDRDLATGNQGALYGPSGMQAGDQSAAAPGRGPATKGPDMEPGCPAAQAEGSNPQAPGYGTGVVVGAVVQVVSSPPPFFVASSSIFQGSRHPLSCRESVVGGAGRLTSPPSL